MVLALFASCSNSMTDTTEHFHLFLQEAPFTSLKHHAHCPIATNMGHRKQTGKSTKAKGVQPRCPPPHALRKRLPEMQLKGRNKEALGFCEGSQDSPTEAQQTAYAINSC